MQLGMERKRRKKTYNKLEKRLEKLVDNYEETLTYEVVLKSIFYIVT